MVAHAWTAAKLLGVLGGTTGLLLASPTRALADEFGTTQLTVYPDGWLSTFNGFANGQDVGEGVAVDSAGDVYLTGQYFNGSNMDALVRKYAPDGTVLWTETYNGAANGNDAGHDIAVDSLGNVYVIGEEAVTSQFSKIWVRKYNTNGIVQWTATYDGGSGKSIGHGVAIDSGGSPYVIGQLYVSGQSSNIWIRKLTSSGSTLWTQMFNSPICDRVGQPTCSTLDDIGFSIAVAPDSSVRATGYENYWPDGTWEEVWVAKLTAAGEVSWIQRYNSPDNDHDHGFGIAVDALSYAYVVGRTVRIEPDGLIHGNALLQRYDPNGTLLWTQVFDLSSNKEENAQGVMVDQAGMIHAIGSRWRDGEGMNVWIRQYDPNGLLVKERTYNAPDNGSDSGQDLAMDTEGNLYAMGAESRTGQGSNLWVRKYAANRPPVLGIIGNKTVIEGQLLSFTVSAKDPDGNSLTFSAAPLPTGATLAGQTFSWTPSLTQAGTYPVTFSVSDGSLTDSETITMTVLDDVSPPSVTITSPLSGGTVPRNTTVTITASASDNVRVTKVDFFVNGSLSCTDLTTPYSCAWRVPSPRGRTYRLQAKAYDAANNVGNSAIVTVTSR